MREREELRMVGLSFWVDGSVCIVIGRREELGLWRKCRVLFWLRGV